MSVDGGGEDDLRMYEARLAAETAAIDRLAMQILALGNGGGSQQDGESVASSSYGGRERPSASPASYAPSRSRSASPSRMSTGNAAGISYRSSTLYRSPAPSKVVGADGVVLSNLARAPRFREEKSDVPGPGKYHAGATPSDFAPVSVPRDEDNEGRVGHTHTTVGARRGLLPTPQAAHEFAMAAATARVVKSPSDSASVSGGGTRSVVSVATASIAAALEAALRREKALKRDVSALRASAQTSRLDAQHALALAHNDTEAVRSALASRDASLLEAHGRMTVMRSAYARVDTALAEMQTALKTAAQPDAYGRSHPAVLRALVAANAMEAVVQEAHKTVGGARAEAGVRVDGALEPDGSGVGGKSGGGGGGGGGGGVGSSRSSVVGGGSVSGDGERRNYSSLSAALSSPASRNVGDLGGSTAVVSKQLVRDSAVATASAAALEPRAIDRPLTGAIGAAMTGGGGTGPAFVVSGSGGRISAADVQAFARHTVGGLDGSEDAGGGEGGLRSSTSRRGRSRSPTSQPRTPPAAATHFGGSGGGDEGATVAERLEQLYSFYTRKSSALEYYHNTPHAAGLRQGEFLSMVRDSGAFDVRLTPASVDLSFTKAALNVGSVAGLEGLTAPRSGQPPLPGASRLTFDQFICCLTDIACRKYGCSEANGRAHMSGGLLVSPEAFKQLLEAHLLPLHARLGAASVMGDGGGSPSSGGTAALPNRLTSLPAADLRGLITAFSEEYLRPDVLAFFNDHKDCFQSIFGTFAAATGGSLSFGNTRISGRGLMSLCSDYKLLPDVLSRTDILVLAREIARASASSARRNEGDTALLVALNYAEVCELLALMAYVAAAVNAGEDGRMASIPLRAGGGMSGALPRDATRTSPGMLVKLQRMLYGCGQRGAPFSSATDGNALLRAVAQGLIASESAAVAAATASGHARTSELWEAIGRPEKRV